ncbi:hypothetical protein KEM48_010780 [Puccinia striiformis f. sp. tritici PST-130]|nr:hypothetical protein KEM48_010780 [Puccinia striiformis f. sp. tritici PST-130]
MYEDEAHSIKFYQKTTTCAPNKTVATLLLKMTARNAIKARAHSEELLERHALRDQPARASGFQSHLHLSDGEDYELDADDFDNLKHARDLRHHKLTALRLSSPSLPRIGPLNEKRYVLSTGGNCQEWAQASATSFTQRDS